MKIPNILNNSDFLDAPLNYKWNVATSEFYYVDANNSKVYEAIAKLNYKATYGIIAALCEWIYWRVSRHIDTPIPLAMMSLEAQWASIIDKRYSFVWNYTGDYISEPANGPIWAMLKIIYNPRISYFMGDSEFMDVDNLVMLARHIAPDKSSFDEWFIKTLKKGEKLFPFDISLKGQAETYDCSVESVIPREFFFEFDYDYEKENNALLINQFLSSLDYNNNKLLNSPEKMIELGFRGTPYEYYVDI